MNEEVISKSSVDKPADEKQPVDKLADGLLDQFQSLKKLETMLSQMLEKQIQLLNGIKELNEFGDEISEVSMMVSFSVFEAQPASSIPSFQMKKMNLYRVKLKNIRAEMLYIAQRVSILKKKAILIQERQVEKMAEKVRQYDYEEGLIAKTKKP